MYIKKNINVKWNEYLMLYFFFLFFYQSLPFLLIVVPFGGFLLYKLEYLSNPFTFNEVSEPNQYNEQRMAHMRSLEVSNLLLCHDFPIVFLELFWWVLLFILIIHFSEWMGYCCTTPSSTYFAISSRKKIYSLIKMTMMVPVL